MKAELRVMLYELFEAALRAAGIGPDRRDPFMDRGDGLLALVDPARQALLLSQVVPGFGQLLAGYHAGLPPRRRLRVRVVVHAGEVRDDDNGSFGEALDIACRLLDAPAAKAALKTAPGPLLLVISGDIHDSLARPESFRQLVTTQVADREHLGWSPVPASIQRPLRRKRQSFRMSSFPPRPRPVFRRVPPRPRPRPAACPSASLRVPGPVSPGDLARRLSIGAVCSL